ncbi:hypothetical protein N007_20735 [Alicyclobacillus acidoterrestris ATCC 49025]|nr:hypothetical protein N007_20735 [Alicyclobacillus acidoterrestris ATCC 49025]
MYLDGENISKESTKDLARKMAILPQLPESPNGFTVAELVSYARFPYQGAFGRLAQNDLDVIDWAMRQTGVSEYRYHAVDSLSGGSDSACGSRWH